MIAEHRQEIAQHARIIPHIFGIVLYMTSITQSAASLNLLGHVLSNPQISSSGTSVHSCGGRMTPSFDRTKPFSSILSASFLVLSVLLLNGCNKNSDNPMAATDQNTPSAVIADNVADEVSDALASNNGGVLDQVNDVFELAAGVGIGAGTALGKSTGDSTLVNRNYDSTAMAWTISVYRQKSALPLSYGVWTRNYWHQFSANGQAQKFRITGNAVADNIKHKLTSGTGYFFTPRLIHHLRAISSDWTATGTNTDTVTINGTYTRSGVDTVVATLRKGTVLDHSLSLTFLNVKGPRGSRLNRSEKTSGTIQGTYTATISAPGKEPMTITKTISIILGGGTATFSVDGTRFVSDLATGDH
jgi:hypothetical protein